MSKLTVFNTIRVLFTYFRGSRNRRHFCLDSSSTTVENNSAKNEDNDYHRFWYLSRRKKMKKRHPPITEDNQYELIEKAVTPLIDVPYERQLQKKARLCGKVLCKINNVIQNSHPENPDLKEIFAKNSVISDGKYEYICPFETFKPSPKIYEYRNKDEFSIGPDYKGKLIAGHFVGSGRGHHITCVEMKNLKVCKSSHKLFSNHLNNFLQNHSKFAPCYMFYDGGHWHRASARTNRNDELLVSFRFHPQNLSEIDVKNASNEVKKYFVDGPGKECNIASLNFQVSTKVRETHEESPFWLLNGEPTITETLHDCKFRISPDAFFQINTEAAEVLYERVRDYCQLGPNTTVLDVCCGTGTIGLLMAKHCKQVYGADIVGQAVENAKVNAKINGVTNAEYYHGEAKYFLRDLLRQHVIKPGDDVVAVLNPARAGLTMDVMESLRKCDAIRRIVYVCCKPHGNAFLNFVSLCHPGKKRLPGTPFIPKRSCGVDLFPHTQHYEIIIDFERL
ncbi:tRNA (uracil-5-)-methyltransferase homolog B-like isoform X2 [Tubulanus polymorphus]|uniref:tRNA (uracil-5-)-methyltransferase homolog B-like isoform X2 n=1 Tax=Tubulanus polymorphus TaxID=672921 RepID=UPI003DA583E9